MKSLMQILGERIVKPQPTLHYEGESMVRYPSWYDFVIPENCIENENGARTDLLGRCMLLCIPHSHQMTEGLPCPKCGWEY